MIDNYCWLFDKAAFRTVDKEVDNFTVELVDKMRQETEDAIPVRLMNFRRYIMLIQFCFTECSSVVLSLVILVSIYTSDWLFQKG